MTNSEFLFGLSLSIGCLWPAVGFNAHFDSYAIILEICDLYLLNKNI